MDSPPRATAIPVAAVSADRTSAGAADLHILNVQANGIDAALRSRIESDRIAMLYRTNLTGTLGTMAMLALAVAVAWGEVAPSVLLAWAASVVGLRFAIDVL